MLPTGANVSQHKYFLSSKLPLQRRCTLCQHYSYKSHPKDHVNGLERRLMSWMKGEFKKLFEETKAIQSRLPTNNGKRDKASTSMKLKVLMQKSNVNSTIKLLTYNTKVNCSFERSDDGAHPIRTEYSEGKSKEVKFQQYSL